MLEEQQVVASASVVKSVDQQPQKSKGEVVILEQPASKKFRFRYKCEGRSAGSIPGANSTNEVKTFPTIQVQNYNGDAIVVVSCVTKDPPYKPHPHNLVGREGCGNGIFTLPIKSADMKMVFSNLGIQCVKKNEIEKSLLARQKIHVDPFRTGFAHVNQQSTIDLNVVRLCFQVFLPDGAEKRYRIPLRPVVSQPIYDKKSSSELVITKLSHSSAACSGGQEVILLCEKVVKEDIAIRFFEEAFGCWEGFGEFKHSSVHKQVAISFRTPRYKTIDIVEPVRVKVQLRRLSDGAVSESLDFEMLPVNRTMCDMTEIRRKRLKTCVEASLNILIPPQRQLDEEKALKGQFLNADCKNPTVSPTQHHQHLSPLPQPTPFHAPNHAQSNFQHHLHGHQINQYQQHHLQGHQINQFQQSHQQYHSNNQVNQNFHQANQYFAPNVQAQYTNGSANDHTTLRNRQEPSKIFSEFASQSQSLQMTSVIFNGASMPTTHPTQNFNACKTENQNGAYFNDIDLTSLSGDLTTMLSVVPDFDTYFKSED